VSELVETLLAVFVGWALAFASGWLFEWNKERKECLAIQRAIRTELLDVGYRLVGVVYFVYDRKGTLHNREVLEWMLSYAELYAGPNPKEGFLGGVKELLGRTDAELQQYADLQAGKPSEPSLFVPRVGTSYASAVVAHVQDFDPDYAQRVLDVLAHIRMFNDTRENCLFYQKLTFTPNLSDENYTSAIHGAEVSLEELAKRARLIVDKITVLVVQRGEELETPSPN